MLEREIALYRWLQYRRVEVSFVTYGGKSELEYAKQIPGIRILCNRMGLPRQWYERLLPFLHARHLRSATIYKSNQTNGAEVALRAARLWGKPFVARCGYMWSDLAAHGGQAHEDEANRAAKIEKKVFEGAKIVVVTTPSMRSYVNRRYDIPPKKIHVVPNYVLTDLFVPDRKNSSGNRVCFVGRLSTEKNPLAIIDACAGLDVELVMVGSGPLQKTVAERAERLGVRLLLLGNIPHRDLPKILNSSQIFILLSPHEGHPKALLEAMACGLAVVGANSPGIRELIHHGETGWICEQEPGSVRAAILELIRNPQLRSALGSRARLFVEENFSLGRIAELELKVLHEAATS